jgi:hypothetical protein
MRTKRTKFTDSFIRSLTAEDKPYAVSDEGCKGLLIRVGAHGTKTFALAYHSPVRARPHISPSAASRT